MGESKFRPDTDPFREPFAAASAPFPSFRDKLRVFERKKQGTDARENLGDQVVRPIDPKKLRRFFPDTVLPRGQMETPAEEKMALMKVGIRAKRLFEELGTRYHLPVATRVVIAESAGKPVSYMVSDRIEGKELEEMAMLPESARVELDGVYASLIEYVLEKHRLDEPFLYDITDRRQYMYGRSNQGTEDHVSLVDVDPKVWSGGNMNQVLIFLSNVGTNIRALELQCAEGSEFSSARRAFLEAVDIFQNNLAQYPNEDKVISTCAEYFRGISAAPEAKAA